MYVLCRTIDVNFILTVTPPLCSFNRCICGAWTFYKPALCACTWCIFAWCRIAGHFEQGTELTSWIDASQVYGNTPDQARIIRDDTRPSRGTCVCTYKYICCWRIVISSCVRNNCVLWIICMLIVYVITRSFGWSSESGDGRRQRSSASGDTVVRPARRRLLRIRFRWASSNRQKRRNSNVSCEVYFNVDCFIIKVKTFGLIWQHTRIFQVWSKIMIFEVAHNSRTCST